MTMRPSDVPTYVEAGAADIGITGKDVLMEQSEREVYELVDLGYGRCTMVLATVAGEDRGGRGAAAARRGADRHQIPADRRPPLPRDRAARRRSSRSRARSSWRRSPAWSRGSSTSPPPGPRCGRTASWSARRSRHCTARLIANPVAHKLKARRDRRAAGADRCGVSCSARRRRRRPRHARAARAGPGAGVGRTSPWREILAAVRARRRRGGARLHARFDTAASRRRRCASPRGARAGRGDWRHRARAPRRARARDRERRRRRRRRDSSADAHRRSACPPRVVLRARARRARRRLRPRRPGAVSEHRRDGGRHGPRGRRAARSSCARRPAATARSTRRSSRACRLTGADERLPDGRRPGDRRARLRDRVDPGRST